jgi:UDP-N-acetylmuramate dehydrogenase
VLREAYALHLPVSILGGGTNTLIPDRGIRGLVIHLGAAFSHLEIMPQAADNRIRVRCGAAVLSQQLVSMAARYGWAGFEALAGLPGQVGGAVVMNAQNIGDFVEKVRLVSPQGELIVLDRKQLAFAYRYSELPTGVIVEVILECYPMPAERAAFLIREKLERRNATQDLNYPSSGCAFRNPPEIPAGKLIDQAGLKGTRIGDAQISERHANFIINVGQASAEDVLALVEYVQQKVYQQSGIKLEPEVRMIGEAFPHEHSNYHP